MKRRPLNPHTAISAVIAAAIVGAGATAPAHAMTAPIELMLRHAIMRADVGVVGRIVATDPFRRAAWDRTSRLVVDSVVFGGAAPGDTLVVGWSSNRRELEDGGIADIACGGGPQLSELTGRSFLWCLTKSVPTRMAIPPLAADDLPAGELRHLADIADGASPGHPDIPLRARDADALEADPLNHVKCEKVAAFLRGAAAVGR